MWRRRQRRVLFQKLFCFGSGCRPDFRGAIGRLTRGADLPVPQGLHVHGLAAPGLRPRGRAPRSWLLGLSPGLGHRRLGAPERVAVVVEEPPEGELVEGVLGVPAARGAQRIPGLGAVLAAVLPGALLVHWVEVGRVHGVADRGHVGGRLPPDVAGEVDGAQERVGLQVVGPVAAQPVLSRAAELGDEVPGLGAQLHLRGDVQRALPVNHLRGQYTRCSFLLNLEADEGRPGTGC